MKDLRVGYYLSHLWRDEPYFRNYTSPLSDNYVKLMPIYRIDKEYLNGRVYNIWAEEPYYRPFLKYMSDEELDEMMEIREKLGIDIKFFLDPPPQTKTTAYLDWLPVEVTYY